MRKTRLCPMALFALMLWPEPLPPQVVDCIVAEVNGKALTLTDIRILHEFTISSEPWAGTRALTLRQTMEEAINRRVVIDLVREDTEVTQQETDDLLVRWKGRFGAGQWEERLAALGLQESALKPYAEEMLRYVKTIDVRFGPEVEIDPQEIERYYQEVYVPSERAMGREPKTLLQATAEVETRIKHEKAEQQAATWVMSLRAQAEVRINERCLEQAR